MAYSYKLWTLEEDLKLQEFVKDGEYSYDTIGTFLNRSGLSCLSHARFLGLYSKFKSGKKYTFNENFWSVPNLINCYWAGYLAADGSIDKKSENNCNIRMELSILDEEQLKILAKQCEYSGPIHHRTRPSDLSRLPTKIISISSPQWGRDLEKNFNIVQNKTKRLQPPPSILNNFDLSLAYLVGYTDGDGCINIHKQGKIPYISWASSSFSILEWVYSFVSLNFHKSRKRKGSIHKFSNYYTAAFGGDITYAIKQAMLPLNLPYLRRKWDKIQLSNDNQVLSEDKIQQTTPSEVNPSLVPI